MKKNINWILTGAFALAIAGIILLSVFNDPQSAAEETAPTQGNATVIVQEKVIEKAVAVERVITGEMIQENIRDMGFLVTQEYNFTEVVDFSKDETRWGILHAKSAFVGSYDGTITAGIDFTKVQVTKNDTAMTVSIVIPEAEIQAIDVDPNSFVLYSETNTWGSRVSAEEYNKCLVALEENAEAKAIEKGLLTKAAENAETILRNFVGGLIDTADYTVTVTTR